VFGQRLRTSTTSTPFIYGEGLYRVVQQPGDLSIAGTRSGVRAGLPIVFTPQLIKTSTGGCTERPPEWLEKAHNTKRSAIAQGLRRRVYSYHDGKTNTSRVDVAGRPNWPVGSPHLAAVGADPAEPLSPETGRCGSGDLIVILVDRPRAVRQTGCRRSRPRGTNDHGSAEPP